MSGKWMVPALLLSGLALVGVLILVSPSVVSDDHVRGGEDRAPPAGREVSAPPGLQAPPRAASPVVAHREAGGDEGGGPPATGQAAGVCVVRGRVTDAVTHATLPGAQVLGMVGTDPRALRYRTGVTAAVTGADGRWELTFAPKAFPAELVFTALARGYQSPHAWPTEDGTGPAQTTQLAFGAPGAQELNLALRPGMDVAGVVVDEEERPIGGVEVVVSVRSQDATGYLEFMETDSDGRFEVHDLEPVSEGGRPHDRGTLEFTHPDHVAARVDDVYALGPPERSSLRVVMPRGLTLRGRLLEADGSWARGVLVEAFGAGPSGNHRGDYTSEEGRFELKGLAPGSLVVRALSAPSLSAVRRELTLLERGPLEDLELRLERLSFAGSASPERVLGLDLVTVPKEARAGLGIYETEALLITAVGGTAPDGLREHALAGDMLWQVGRQAVASPSDVARAIVSYVDTFDQIRARGGLPPSATCTVPFVLGIRRPDMCGTNTQSMTLTREQVNAMRAGLEAAPKPR